jgi:hypothetical protein
MKTCLGCQIEKDRSEFTGAKKKCRACISEYNRAYSQARMKSDPVFRARRAAQASQWAKDNPEKRSVIATRRNAKAWASDPLRMMARSCIAQQVKRGNRPAASSLTCACGEPAAHYHHHNGYEVAHRYDVVPVCVPCHKSAHSSGKTPVHPIEVS